MFQSVETDTVSFIQKFGDLRNVLVYLIYLPIHSFIHFFLFFLFIDLLIYKYLNYETNWEK